MKVNETGSENRLIGIYDEGNPGPLIFMIGGIHGNEQAGVLALEYLIKMLEVEPVTNEKFVFSGRLVALRGNLQALQKKTRFVDRDLNRMFRPELLSKIRNQKTRKDEERELVEMIDFINHHIDEYQSGDIFVLDLHTTSVSGGIFTIIDDSPRSLKLGLELGAPVIEGFLSGLKGTLLHYMNAQHLNQQCVAMVFEAGKHEDKLSVNRAIAAAVNFLSAVGSVERFHIAPRHGRILWESANGLPAHCRLIYTHSIRAEDRFQMQPGFTNFDPILKGQVLAMSAQGPVVSPVEGLLLMPLYQEKGEDGFFIIEPVSDQKIT